jgi:branched-chain amino acid transport system ATP-binding protein
MVGELFGKLHRIREQKVTMVLIEQNVHHALEFASRAYVLRTGEVAFSGLSGDLLASADLQRAYLGHA